MPLDPTVANNMTDADAAADPLNLVDWLPDSMQPIWALVNQSPMIGALVIALFFFLVAFIARNIIISNLERLFSRTSGILDSALLEHFRKPVFTTILYFGLALACEAAQLPKGTILLVNICLSVIVGSWIRASFLLSSTSLDALARSRQRFRLVEPHTVPLLDLTIKLIVLLIGSYCLLTIWGINPVGWLASAGIVGLAVGFAAKDTLANLFSGFFILVDRPYKIGDYVNLDSGERGRVTNIGLRSTRLLSRDDIEIILPNAIIANAKIVNESGGPKINIRIRASVGVAYGSDLEKVCAVLEKVAQDRDDLCRDPAPRVRMRGFGKSSLDFELLAWINRPEDRGLILHELYMSIYKSFKAESIEIPFTKTDIYIKEMPHWDSED